MTPHSAITTDLFADEQHRQKINMLGDPLTEIEPHIDFGPLAAEIERVVLRPVSPQGERPPHPTGTMVRIVILTRLCNLLDEQLEYQLLVRMSYKRFCCQVNAVNIPDCTTKWVFENCIGETSTKALLEDFATQLPKKGLITRCSQIIGATRTKKHGKNYFDRVLGNHNTSRGADASRGYPSEDRETKRKEKRNKPLSECQQRRNKRIAKTRTLVEHLFATIAQMGCKLIRTIGHAQANFAMTMMAACYIYLQ